MKRLTIFQNCLSNLKISFSKLKIKSMRYDFLRVKTKIRESWASFTNTCTNWYLFDQEDNNSLLHPGNELNKLNEPKFVDMLNVYHETHYSFWTFIAIVFSRCIIIFIIITSNQASQKFSIARIPVVISRI